MEILELKNIWAEFIAHLIQPETHSVNWRQGRRFYPE